ncbi:diaminopimelate epimerase [Enterococcus sp. PF1-24]|uniref:diaminopimelate epimerase n=1 Tax=unclassified Enterococcus TaxID=2608891 RepID=UPI002473EE1C|nr:MULTISPECIES: diaminopimelate epimerase [unclassified Enterococcus]MDH6363617.1 diaminopimelate epimerase [Enterococcus sp. PFB1-1]MDH6400852.1 diaminopimelate epimerase [Enterococcus sp. PF1-24]
MQLYKVHGSENDFFILDQRQFSEKLSDGTIDELRQAICPRTTGLLGGADGILLVEATTDQQTLAQMRVINSDGSEASMCGNGLRTVARYLAEKHHLTSFKVKTMHGDLSVSQAPAIFNKIATYQVEISPVSFEPTAIPVNLPSGQYLNQVLPELSETLRFSIVAVPNPHLITFVSHEVLESDLLEKIASKVNQENALFPDGVNVSFVEILEENRLFVRTYERGVGLTNACGTAMSASSLIYALLQGAKFEQLITVVNPGGLVQTRVHQRANGSYWMDLIGNATVTHEITGELADFLKSEVNLLKLRETHEQRDYQQFLAAIASAVDC